MSNRLTILIIVAIGVLIFSIGATAINVNKRTGFETTDAANVTLTRLVELPCQFVVSSTEYPTFMVTVNNCNHDTGLPMSFEPDARFLLKKNINEETK